MCTGQTKRSVAVTQTTVNIAISAPIFYQFLSARTFETGFSNSHTKKVECVESIVKHFTEKSHADLALKVVVGRIGKYGCNHAEPGF